MVLCQERRGRRDPRGARRAHAQGADVRARYSTVQQMFYAALSLELHRADPRRSIRSRWTKKLQAQYTPFAYVDGHPLL